MSRSPVDYFKIAQDDFRLIENILRLQDRFCFHDTIEYPYPFEGCFGYRTRRVLPITCFESSESKKFDLEIARGFQLNSEGGLIPSYYRYCLRWYYDITVNEFQTLKEDYLHESIITLKRSIRFDYHPNVDSLDPLEKNYHWHPNGCSEIKKATPMLEPIHAVAFGAKFFAPDIYGRFSSDIRNIVDSIF